jgi:hypothetical protein
MDEGIINLAVGWYNPVHRGSHPKDWAKVVENGLIISRKNVVLKNISGQNLSPLANQFVVWT